MGKKVRYGIISLYFPATSTRLQYELASAFSQVTHGYFFSKNEVVLCTWYCIPYSGFWYNLQNQKTHDDASSSKYSRPLDDVVVN